METLGERLRYARQIRNLSPSELAKKIGMTVQGVVQIENGKTKGPRPDNLFRLAQACGVNPEWLATGKGTPLPGKTITTYDDPAQLPENRYAMIPLLDVRLSAGAGVWTEDHAETRYSLAFLRGWIERNHYKPENLRLLEVTGDSMEPRIYDGDVVLIDIGDTTPRNGRIYALVYQDWVYLKRINIRLDGQIEVSSDNPKYRPELVAPDEQDRLKIIGRCVWAGGDGGL